MNNPGGAHDGRVVFLVAGTPFFPTICVVATRLIERFGRAFRRTETGVVECQRLKDFTFDKVFPTHASRAFGHRRRNRVADI